MRLEIIDRLMSLTWPIQPPAHQRQAVAHLMIMETSVVNVLLTSFPGLKLPATLSFQTHSSTPISTLTAQIYNRLPDGEHRLIITTTSNRQLLPSSAAPVASLLSSSKDVLLPLRLSVPLCGGKGGFGSQLRAAGGRMSSRRKRNQGENNGSNRNLDGRRLRVVTEAKNLAEYLAVKPEMERREKEDRRKRWEQVGELAEKREEEIKSGARGKVDGKWVEDKEEAGERTREAVLAAIRSGDYKDTLLSTSSGSSARLSRDDPSVEDGVGGSGSRSQATPPPSASKLESASGPTLFGFDEDDEFMSEDETGEEDQAEEPSPQPVQGKGKGRA